MPLLTVQTRLELVLAAGKTLRRTILQQIVAAIPE